MNKVHYYKRLKITSELPEAEEYLYLELELLWTDGDDVKSNAGANMLKHLEWYENVFIYYEK